MKSVLAIATILMAQNIYAAPSLQLEVVNNSRQCQGKVTGVLETTNNKGKPVTDKLTIKVKADGFSGNVRYNYFHTTDGLEVLPSQYGKEALSIKENSRETAVTFQLPALRNDRFFAEVLLVVTAIDSKGQVSKAAQPIVLSREVLVEKEEDTSKSCTQTYQPEPISGLYENQNDVDMTISTSTGVTTITEERKSKTLGWSLVPTIFTGDMGISLFGLNSSRLKGLAKSVNETSYTTVTHTLNPGDVAFQYSQKLRIKEAYRIAVANGCGQFRNLENERIYLDREVVVFNVYKVAAPFSKTALEETLKTKSYGRPVNNTCRSLDAITIPFAN